MDLTILQGDAIEQLRTLPDRSVQCCVTSPPYYGLRDYGVGRWEGGDGACDHRHQLGGEGLASAKQNTNAGMQMVRYRGICGKCGAVRIDKQLGLEATPDEYVARMVEIFREVRRVLRDDGVLWLNVGDSYAGSGKGRNGDGTHGMGSDKQSTSRGTIEGKLWRADIPDTVKPKDLFGIPWMLAFALRADGWYLRQDVIWHKPNPMPESVRDRCTKAHEYVFLLTKSASYYYDADAIKEEAVGKPSGNKKRREAGERGIPMNGDGRTVAGGNQASSIPWSGGEMRNARSVWTVTPQPFRGAHFATMPPALVERCVRAGSRIGDVVLDPFAGSGTTGMVALQLGRCATLIELNENYIPLIQERCNVSLIT